MGYKNPTLTEILAELHMEEGSLPEKSFIALASELATRGFDNQEFAHTAIIEKQDEGQEPEPKLVPRIRCWDRERIGLIQFSPDAVYANLTGEYPGWEKFGEHLRTTLAAITKVLKTQVPFTRIALVTIDKWKIDRSGFTIGQYLNCGGPLIPQWYSEVSVSSDISLGQGFYQKDGFNKKVNITVRTSDDTVQFQIYINLGVTDKQKGFDAVMDHLHSESIQCFESLITDRVRNEIMGGRK